jgi:hypothetical protein
MKSIDREISSVPYVFMVAGLCGIDSIEEELACQSRE